MPSHADSSIVQYYFQPGFLNTFYPLSRERKYLNQPVFPGEFQIYTKTFFTEPQ